jgi:hypothetical protein
VAAMARTTQSATPLLAPAALQIEGDMNKDTVADVPYWQYNLMVRYDPAKDESGQPEGVCFRLAFKWLACKINGTAFKYGYDDSGIPTHNPENVLRKQREYLEPIKPYEGKGRDYGGFLMHANQTSLTTLQGWGNKVGKAGGLKYNLTFRHVVTPSLAHRQEFAEDSSLVIGIYGMSKPAGPWAHATAFHRRAGQIEFFDANGGEFHFAATQNAGAEIQEWVTERYAGMDGTSFFVIKDYILYKVV